MYECTDLCVWKGVKVDVNYLYDIQDGKAYITILDVCVADTDEDFMRSMALAEYAECRAWLRADLADRIEENL